MNKIAKLTARVILLIISVLASYVLIIVGLGEQGISGSENKNLLALILGLLYFPLLVVFLFLSKSYPRADRFFWYLGVGFPLGAVIPLIVL